MEKSNANPRADFFFVKAKKWREEYEELREIILSCGLTEEVKWGCPCYSLNGKNVVLIHGFKEYCALLFMKGALLKDPGGILIRQTENVQSARQVRFTGLAQILKMRSTIKTYVKAAIAVERSGAKVELKRTKEFPVAEEFKNKLDEMPELRRAFYALTPGRQRGYLLFFSSAKQSATREARVEKCIPAILKGKGLDD